MDSENLYAIAASPISPPAVIAIDRRNHEVRVLAGGAEMLPAADQPAAAYPLWQ